MVPKPAPTKRGDDSPETPQEPDLRLLPDPQPETSASLRVHLIPRTSRTDTTTKEHARLFNDLLDHLGIPGKFRMSQTPNSYHPTHKETPSVSFLMDSDRLKIRVCDSKDCFAYVVESEDESMGAAQVFETYLEKVFFLEDGEWCEK